MNSLHLVEKFESCRRRGEALVLVTVWETQGSTYSKAGTRMLITAGGESQGLVSGGCLESDLAERARRVLASGRPATVSFDLRDESDELFGLGIGCNGLINVLLQPVGEPTAYEPLASIVEALLGRTPGALATVIDSDSDTMVVGASVAHIDGQTRVFGVPEESVAALAEGCRRTATQTRARLVADSSGCRVLYAPLVPVPRVLVLGAGLDAVPLVNVIAELGWRVTVADHRPAYLDREAWVRAEACFAVTPGSLCDAVDPAIYDAIVVMSHHLASDREYLRQLAVFDTPYLGLLGPPARKERLLEELGEDAKPLGARLRGPAGVDIGADSAESIAVSIAAEIQQVLVRA